MHRPCGERQRNTAGLPEGDDGPSRDCEFILEPVCSALGHGPGGLDCSDPQSGKTVSFCIFRAKAYLMIANEKTRAWPRMSLKLCPVESKLDSEEGDDGED